MNLPNKLTLSRLAMAFILLILLTVSWPGSKILALLVFAVGGVTDYLDGRLARGRHGITAFGQLMDPLTDKVMVCAAFISLVELGLVSAVVAVIIVSREFLVTGMRLIALKEGRVVAAGTWGKHKTLWQIVVIAMILLGLAIRDDVLARRGSEVLADYDRYFGWFSHAVSIAVAVVTVISGWIYWREHRELITRDM